jgi:L-rhamnose isomerase/sugar isomerase
MSSSATVREAVKTVLKAQEIETSSWGYGNSGTRFKVFAQAGVPRDPFEKIADAAQVHAVTGVAPLVSLHIPWDRVEDDGTLAAHASDLGVRIGMINSNTEAGVRRTAADHLLDCVPASPLGRARD